MARKTLTEKRTLYMGLQKGIRKRWKTHAPISIDMVDYSPQDMDGILQQLLEAIRDVELAEAALHGAVAKRLALEKKHGRLVNEIAYRAQREYGSDVEALGAFSLGPRGVPGPKKLDVKVASAQRARETRARGGKRAKTR